MRSNFCASFVNNSVKMDSKKIYLISRTKTDISPILVLWIMTLMTLLQLGPSGGHSLTLLSVPLLADPRQDATLSCRYNMEGDRLYSAKWFKDDQEIYRYMPGQDPTGLQFPIPGVELAHTPQCSSSICDLQLTSLTSRSKGLYRCEVSNEAPMFQIVHKSANMTIGAVFSRAPVVTGLQPRYSYGDTIRLNCSTEPTLPRAKLTWTYNDKEATFLNLEGPHWSSLDRFGLSSSWVQLTLVVDRLLFPSPPSPLTASCAASLPASLPGGPYSKKTTLHILMPSTHNHLTNEKLAWPGNQASRSSKTLTGHLLLFFLYTYTVKGNYYFI